MKGIAAFDLTPFNTMGLSAKARFGMTINTPEQVAQLVDFAHAQNLPLHIIGEGSNIILHDDINAVVGVMATKGIAVKTTADGQTLVTAQAGENWASFVQWTAQQGLGGLENLAAIPGTVGAAPIQNIGAYGLEVAERIDILTVYDTHTRTVKTLSREACAFSYRDSMLKRANGRYIVLDVTFILPKAWQAVLSYAGLDTLPADATPLAVHDRVVAVRASKLPDWHTLGNAGSFFHNPVVPAAVAEKIEGVPRYPLPDAAFTKLSAAWLIEACGLKGYRQGGAGVYDHHALILVNHGSATYRDIATLADKIKQAVYARFGVQLVQEPIEIE